MPTKCITKTCLKGVGVGAGGVILLTQNFNPRIGNSEKQYHIASMRDFWEVVVGSTAMLLQVGDGFASWTLGGHVLAIEVKQVYGGDKLEEGAQRQCRG
mmetsp:Transcript_40149/g.71760  ORF Transcript_40149/g.71760 Transcript_40149/m.71760 type:complete len:99 (+) Transcript_40149:77-373(+)